MLISSPTTTIAARVLVLPSNTPSTSFHLPPLAPTVSTESVANNLIDRALTTPHHVTTTTTTQVPDPQSCSATPSVSHLIGEFDKKEGHARITPSILYRYPPNTAPPPTEVCDFCLPYGASLDTIPYKEEENIVQEILFGYAHGKRSGRCFIFMLEDKTIPSSSSAHNNNSNNGSGKAAATTAAAAGQDAEDDQEEDNDEDLGVSGKLYGICVLHPRLLKTNIQDIHKRRYQEQHGDANNNNSNEEHDPSTPHATNTNHTVDDDHYEFESLVCYMFLTRFPFFAFFFQMLFDIITLERLRIMELTSFSDGSLIHSKASYEYINSELLNSVLQQVVRINPPRFGQTLSIQINPDVPRIGYHRLHPSLTPGMPSFPSGLMLEEEDSNNCFAEDEVQVLEWCFPSVLASVTSTHSLHCLIWAISLLLLESKVLIVGTEPALVTSTVLSLLLCVRPFEWVSPVIPILPLKWKEFVESPVPLLAGIVLDQHTSATATGTPTAAAGMISDSGSFTIHTIMEKCR